MQFSSLSILNKPADNEVGFAALKIARAFAWALDLAAESAGATSPNPPVACALLNDQGRVLSMAAHQRAGTPHAEALAIDACRRDGLVDQIHTVVTTLEPCNHFGRMPPCVDAILSTPAKTVIIGSADPNPHVCSGGAARLQASGLTVTGIEAIDETLAMRSDRLIAPFAKRSRTGVPWITVKQAFDESDSMLPPAGRKTFTSPESLVLAHRLRRRADAILTGSGTIVADLPEFTVRHLADHPDKRRKLVILDRRGRVPVSYLEAANSRGFDTLVATDIAEALAQLGPDVLEVLVEAGADLSTAILEAGLWDERVIIQKRAGQADVISVEARHDVFRHH